MTWTEVAVVGPKIETTFELEVLSLVNLWRVCSRLTWSRLDRQAYVLALLFSPKDKGCF